MGPAGLGGLLGAAQLAAATICIALVILRVDFTLAMRIFGSPRARRFLSFPSGRRHAGRFVVPHLRDLADERPDRG